VTWAKLDDAFYDHPKVLRAGEDAADLYVRGLAYCSRYLTDGAIPMEALSRLSTRRNVRASAEKLVDTKLWERDGNVYRVHDYLTWNPSADEVHKLRESKRDAGSRGAKARWKRDGRSVAGAMAGAMADTMADTMAGGQQNDGSRARSPTPTPTEEKKNAASAANVIVPPDQPPPGSRNLLLDPMAALHALSEASGGIFTPHANGAVALEFVDALRGHAVASADLAPLGRWMALRAAECFAGFQAFQRSGKVGPAALRSGGTWTPLGIVIDRWRAERDGLAPAAAAPSSHVRADGITPIPVDVMTPEETRAMVRQSRFLTFARAAEPAEPAEVDHAG